MDQWDGNAHRGLALSGAGRLGRARPQAAAAAAAAAPEWTRAPMAEQAASPKPALEVAGAAQAAAHCIFIPAERAGPRCRRHRRRRWRTRPAGFKTTCGRRPHSGRPCESGPSLAGARGHAGRSHGPALLHFALPCSTRLLSAPLGQQQSARQTQELAARLARRPPVQRSARPTDKWAFVGKESAN